MKKLIFFISFILFGSHISAQIYDPVTWDFSYEKKGEKQYELIFTANIEKNSHIYSMDIPSGGPIPTSFRIDSLPGYKLDGKTYEVTKPVEVFDDAFGFKIKTFSKTAEFRQKITDKNAGQIIKNSTESVVNTEPVKTERGLLKFFLISLLAGFAGVLTPCVFPMIPMTVAFFSQGSDERGKAIFKALIFGISIVLIYSSLGIIVSLTSAGAGFANALSTHWIPNTIFFVLFVVFAVSFFGAFEILLPNSWVTRADSRVDKGGILAAFFMGLTTVIVSFSCTGPIIGALLVEAASGDVLRPTIGMIGFGVAFALPFTIFALFPSIMSRIPKSGGWLNSIKVVLGFIMLAFSMKFLTTIDSVYSLGILSRSLFISIWIVLFSLLGFYLMGKIKFSHDSDLPFISTFRLFLIIIVFTFVVYLIPGLFGAPLTGLSSFLPSQDKSEFNLPKLIMENRGAPEVGAPIAVTSQLCSEPKYSDIFEMPLGLKGYFDYKQGLACAKEKGMPVFIDFKGHACANCKRMEAKVWSDPEVFRRLRDLSLI